MADETPKIQRIARVARAFTPGAPIDRLSLFAGRFAQVQDVASAISQRGYHVGLYGERGVGKTSLANVLAEIFDAPDLPQIQAVLVTCNTDSSFQSVWRDIFRELGSEAPAEITPENVRHEIARRETLALIVIDELDRLEDDASLTLLADTIKSLSDHSVPSTLVLVGVARSLGDLIGEHQSIVRNLAQIEMPRMSRRELRELVDKGSDQCGLTVRDDAIAKIVALSEGLPHYTHLLGLHAGTRVVQNDRAQITLDDVNAAIPTAVARHTIKSDYVRATRSTRADNLYPQVLLACALARKNQLGYFTAGAVRNPLEAIAGRRIEIPAFARHLAQFLEPERGPVLEREGHPRHYFYRFADPILQPYVILNGLSEGLITDERVFALQADGESEDDWPPGGPQQLF